MYERCCAIFLICREAIIIRCIRAKGELQVLTDTFCMGVENIWILSLFRIHVRTPRHKDSIRTADFMHTPQPQQQQQLLLRRC
jgi:hypothetical protein